MRTTPRKPGGFSLVELLITVTIIAILAAIAVPQYSKYVRNARTSEAISNLGAIGMYQETYFSENDQYYTCQPNPSAVPNPSDPGGKKAFDATFADWQQLGRVIPEGTLVVFQYEVRAGRRDGAGGDVTAVDGLVAQNAAVQPGGAYCTNHAPIDAASLNIPDTANSNWFYATAVGDQTGDGKCSLFIKVIDRTEVVKENDIE